jgi:hypothetical protein
MPLWRSQQKNIYHDCARCGFRQPLSKMKWQNGLLVCSVTDCIDHGPMPIVGTRDIAVARAVSVWRHELEPDKKLTEPVDRKNDEQEVLY